MEEELRSSLLCELRVYKGAGPGKANRGYRKHEVRGKKALRNSCCYADSILADVSTGSYNWSFREI
ncbi:MAG: hypothetical protein ACLR6J_10150 [Parabacteroides merdae]